MSPWNRRSFLTAGALGTAGLAIDNKRRLLASAAKPWNVSSGRALRKFRDPLPTVCRACTAHCGIVAFRDADRVVQLQGASGSPTNRGGLCPRAHAGLERLYDPERVLHPLRRKGPRGSGQWEPVSWEQALAEISARLAKRRGSRVLHIGQEELLVQELRGALSWDDLLVDEPFAGRPGPGSGDSLYGAPVLAPDLSRARTVFLLGAHLLEGRFGVASATGLLEARGSGANIHLFDAFEGVTGSLATWQRVAPGSEAAVAFGIARLLLQRKRFDAQALGARVSDGPDRLLAALESYTPEAVEKVSGLSASRLTSLSESFWAQRPSVAIAPPGSAAATAAALLNHLARAVDAPGGIPTRRGPFFVEALRPTAAPEAWLRELAEGRAKADLYWVANANPAYDAPQSAEVGRALADPQRVGLLVVMDTHLTETALAADLFLPLATPFECWGLVEGALPDGRSYLFLQQPVTRPVAESEKLKNPKSEQLSLFQPWPKPLGEARSLPDVLLPLARSLGSRDFSAIPDSRFYLEELLRRSWGPGSLEALQRRGIWVSEEGQNPEPGKKVSLARLIPPVPAPAAEGALGLVATVSATLPRAYSNSRRGLEMSHRSEAFLHPQTAARLGVRNGERVTLKTSVGTVEVPVRLIQGIHPGAVALPDGLGHRAGGAAAQAKTLENPPVDQPYLVKRKDFLSNPLGLAVPAPEPGDPIWWEEEGPGTSLRLLFPFRPGPDGAQNWGALPVEVRKV